MLKLYSNDLLSFVSDSTLCLQIGKFGNIFSELELTYMSKTKNQFNFPNLTGKKIPLKPHK